jgi:hypothetical protein
LNPFISGIPYRSGASRQFTPPVYAIFTRNGRDLPRPPSDIEEIIELLSKRPKPRLSQRLIHLHTKIAVVSVNKPDEGTNMVVFNVKGFLMNDHQMEVFQN